MELDDAIKGRRSIRKYLKKPVERDLIINLIEAANDAPSWKNSQTSRYYVINTENRRKEFIEKCLPSFNQSNVKDAPVIIVSTVVTGISGFKDGNYQTHLKDGYQYFDNGLQIQNLCLKAYSLGLGTLIMGLYNEEETRNFLEIPDCEKITVVMSLGYPDINPKRPSRKDVSGLLKFDR